MDPKELYRLQKLVDRMRAGHYSPEAFEWLDVPADADMAKLAEEASVVVKR